MDTRTRVGPPSPKLANILLLSTLAADLGIRVPPTRHLDAGHFGCALRHAVGMVPEEVPLTVEAFRTVQASLLRQPLPPELRRVLAVVRETLARSSGSPLAVRSCFELEDSSAHSFAGTFSSFLAVATEPELGRAVSEVYASAFSPRALDELLAAGLTRLPSMWVAIQPMLGGVGWVGGVAQTQAVDLAPFPIMSLSVSDDVSSVTSASAIPEEYLLARDNVDSPRAVCLHRQPGETTHTRFLLQDDPLRDLARRFLAIEEAFSHPQELEWLLSPDGELCLLQARPLSVEYSTAVCVAAPDHAERLLCAGLPVGNGRVHGSLYFAATPAEALSAPPGAVLAVPGRTDADWASAVRHAACVVTAVGSRGSHFARIARDTRRIAVVGCGDAVLRLPPAAEVTVFCAEGLHGAVYLGDVPAGQLATRVGDVVVRGGADAFTQARTTRPRRIYMDPAALLLALQLPEDPSAGLSPRLARMVALYATLEAFITHRLLEEISMVGLAFSGSPIVVLPTVPDRWRPALADAIRQAESRFGLTVSLSPG